MPDAGSHHDGHSRFEEQLAHRRGLNCTSGGDDDDLGEVMGMLGDRLGPHLVLGMKRHARPAERPLPCRGPHRDLLVGCGRIVPVQERLVLGRMISRWED